MSTDNPIFIGGLDNSGKTALRLALSSHPNIAMTRRSYMWTRIYGRYGDLSEAGNLERCLAALLRQKDVRAMEPDEQRLRQEFRQGEASYGRLFGLLHEQYAQRLGKERWGEQEGRLEAYADELFAAYPGAKVIHMIRDPRNRYEEMLQTTPPRFRLGRVGVNTKDWLRSVRLARRNQGRYPGSYLVLHYETLLSVPEQALRQVCAFIGEEYVASMLTMEDAIRFGDQPDTNAASEWENAIVDFRLDGSRKVSPREAAFMQAFAGGEMRAWGYAPQPVSLSPIESVLYCTMDWPFGLVRMAAGSRAS